MIFIALALTVLLCAGLYGRAANKPTKRFFWVLSCLLMFSLLAFRSEYMGTDTYGYVRGFRDAATQSLKSLVSNTGKDVGYAYLVKGLTCVSRSEVWFLSSTAFLSCFGIWDYIKRNSVNPVLSLFFYIILSNYTFTFTGIRQSIAMSMCAFSLRYAEKRKIIPFAMIVYLASTIHKSALLFLPTFFLPWIPLTGLTAVLGCIFTATCMVSYSTFSAQINELLGYSYTIEGISNGFFYYVLILAIVVVAFLYRKKWVRSRADGLMLSTSAVSVVVWTFRLVDRIAERPSMYWQTTLPVTVVNSLYEAKHNRNSAVLLFGIIVVALAIFTKRALGWNYMFFWETMY